MICWKPQASVEKLHHCHHYDSFTLKQPRRPAWPFVTRRKTFCHENKLLPPQQAWDWTSARLPTHPWNDTSERSRFQQRADRFWTTAGMEWLVVRRMSQASCAELAERCWRSPEWLHLCTIMVNVDLLMKGINMHLSLVHTWGLSWPQFLGTIYSSLSNPEMLCNPPTFMMLSLRIYKCLKLKVGKIDMQDDVTVQHLHPSASWNGKKSSHQEGSMFSLQHCWCESVQMSPCLLQMTPNSYQSDDAAQRAAYW